MTKRKATARNRRRKKADDDALQGPPAHETVLQRSDLDRRAEQELRTHTSSSPALAGGDVDADWARADSVGEEAPGGTVATPDQDVVDDLGDALGVSRSPDEPFRPSSEILEERDRRRRAQGD